MTGYATIQYTRIFVHPWSHSIGKLDWRLAFDAWCDWHNVQQITNVIPVTHGILVSYEHPETTARPTVPTSQRAR